ncbi:hypothetical protein QUF70_21960 [Desulfobacterales bacterium HSG17]|nr:hypothetical protein [Desulfobacterales bacterium HSG17]
MDAFEAYLSDEAFRLFQDKALREHACNTVEKLCKNNGPKDFMDKSQLYPIPAVIQSGGFDGLSKLVKNQQEKNTKKKNKVFWSFMLNHLINVTGDKDTFQSFVRDEMSSFLQDESKAETRVIRNQMKKENKRKINQVINLLLPAYFEHFNCHYFYYAAINKLHK